MRGDAWDNDFLDEGREDIQEAKTKFKKFKDGEEDEPSADGNAASSSNKIDKKGQGDVEEARSSIDAVDQEDVTIDGVAIGERNETLCSQIMTKTMSLCP